MTDDQGGVTLTGTGGEPVYIRSHVADIAELLDELTATDAWVERTRLRKAWDDVAADLRRSRSSSRDTDRGRGRGSLAAQRLKDALAALEKLGAARRLGDAERAIVVVTDRAILRRVVSAYDRG